MAHKTIFLLRHGQTDYNKSGIVQGGRIDSSINEIGQEQAKAFYEKYKHTGFDKVYTSGLQRTWQSVHQFIEDGIPHEKLEGLNEISWGKYDGTKLFENKHYWDVVAEWQKGNTDVTTDVELGESPDDVVLRQEEAMKHIMSKDTEETILVCMHGRAMRILLCHLLGESIGNMEEYGHHNLGFYLLSHDGENFKIEQNNVISHLEEVGLADK
ncbi:MAG: histidine phosphatase family protein [Cytophagales bacterium]|nr:histidine phosphatase family protein [Cytophagales bacterium]